MGQKQAWSLSSWRLQSSGESRHLSHNYTDEIQNCSFTLWRGTQCYKACAKGDFNLLKDDQGEIMALEMRDEYRKGKIFLSKNSIFKGPVVTRKMLGTGSKNL